MSDYIEQHKYLRSNVAHLLALITDSVLEQLAGGLHTLHTQVTLHTQHTLHTQVTLNHKVAAMSTVQTSFALG